MIRMWLFAFQKLLATVAFFVTSALGFRRRPPSVWLIGVHEVASMVQQLGAAIPDSRTIVDRPHPYYRAAYDTVLSGGSSRLSTMWRLLKGPVVLGAGLVRAKGIVYVGNLGFLISDFDERAWEFSFVRAHGRKVVVVFTGNDIRSPAQMTALAEQTGFENLGAIIARQGAPFDTPAYEEARRERSRVADEYASAIFTASVDQLSYLTRETLPFPYLYPDEQFIDARGKFTDLSRIRILHAPSRPELKGTAAVREAVARLKSEHPEVEYVELTDVDNGRVREELTRAHIVLNQFHAYMPGVFGIEAMAHQCVMVCSANPAVETDLPDADGAWVIADTTTLYDRLTALLASPQTLIDQALRGQDWARRYASSSTGGARLRAILDELPEPPGTQLHAGDLPNRRTHLKGWTHVREP